MNTDELVSKLDSLINDVDEADLALKVFRKRAYYPDIEFVELMEDVRRSNKALLTFWMEHRDRVKFMVLDGNNAQADYNIVIASPDPVEEDTAQ